MKVCPQCRTEYTDDGLKFCLQDGRLLDSPNQITSPNFNTESETVISPKRVEPIRFDPPSSYQSGQENWEESQPVVVTREPKKSNTAMIVALTVLGTILILGLGGAGAWLYFNNKKNVAVVNTDPVNAPNRSTNFNAANNQNSNANSNANVNLAAPTPIPAPTPTAKPAINPQQAKAISNDVENVVDNWKNSSENLDITSHLSNYANTVDYYLGGKVGIAKVRADKEKAFSNYDSIEFNIDNMRVIPDPTGEKATAIFDKEWKFEGADKYSAGKVQQQLTLVKINGKWLISGEKDLKLYYKE